MRCPLCGDEAHYQRRGLECGHPAPIDCDRTLGYARSEREAPVVACGDEGSPFYLQEHWHCSGCRVVFTRCPPLDASRTFIPPQHFDRWDV